MKLLEACSTIHWIIETELTSKVYNVNRNLNYPYSTFEKEIEDIVYACDYGLIISTEIHKANIENFGNSNKIIS